MTYKVPHTMVKCRYNGCTYTYRAELTPGGAQQLLVYAIGHLVRAHWDMMELNHRIMTGDVSDADLCELIRS